MSDAPRQTVLIAEANASDRRSLHDALSDAGYAVVEAGTGAETLQALREERFDVVLTDMWMPDTDGIAVIQSIRYLSPETEIIVVTGGGPGLSIASAAALAQVWGARKVYVKPPDMKELIGELESLFAPLNAVPKGAGR